jgi:hypothetical protein
MEEIYISNGNRRMNIPTFSLPAGKTCFGSTPHCEKYCYAKKAEKSYPNVLPSRERNLRVSKTNDFVRQVSKWIMKHKPKYFRIHESGDFYSQEYIDKWMNIIKLCPDTNFLAYTQVYRYNFEFEDLDNFVLYYSIWDDTDMKEVPINGLYAFVYDETGQKIHYNKGINILLPDVKKCMKEEKDIGCEQCLWCFKGKGNVKFQLH